MRDINDLVQEFWRLSRDGVVGASFSAMYRLHKILQDIWLFLEVCFDIISFLCDLADKNLQSGMLDDSLGAKFKMMLDGYQKMLDQSFSKSEDVDDMLRFLRGLPGVVVQKPLTIQAMADIHRTKPDLLERLIESTVTIGPLRSFHEFSVFSYVLDPYLSGFLKDRDRSQLYYCDPIVQHISICRHFLSLLNGSNAFDLYLYVFHLI